MVHAVLTMSSEPSSLEMAKIHHLGLLADTHMHKSNFTHPTW
jgi:hypothetical protein